MLSSKRMQKPYKTKLNWDKIKLMIFDCDGVLTDGRIIYDNNRLESKNFDAHDGMGFILLRQTEVMAAVITGRSSTLLEQRCADLKIKHLYQGVASKLTKTEELLKELGLCFENVLYMGDDWNDIPVMFKAAISVCPANAAPDIKGLSDYVTSHEGGRGAVRECIELVLINKRLIETAVTAYLDEISPH
ncbi:MAG: HAD hydrolase family protein [Candidatus Cloacimonadaceae bacterium]|nr:HAD hydrolase family protein [Candidatus Cloacimonadaceae bacterium]MDP3114226.1 HAD hydrolase family protein [Candidatus Cloacimonadaceae bacterium]